MMELLPYWPTLEHIKECIRTEAEEFPEHTLLAVHEPMRLKRRGMGGTKECSDEELLEDFLKVERPIPIIGQSGVGKSHLLRWLHAKLRIHPESTGWHIVRIPKNASLRGVLEKILHGLEGEAFEQALQRVKTVGEQLNTQEVAQLLLTFMGQQLRRLYEQVQIEIDRYQKLGSRPDEKEKDRLVVIRNHCGENGLPSLINDPYFQEFLLKEKHCVYQFAKRLTSGANDDELDSNDYQVHASDLDFNYNLNDLARPGRHYVLTAQLNTNETKRHEAADMLNLVLGDATRTAFQKLFQFGGSNFQDLFKQIRRDLFVKRQTLVVLVEDMAAISAIEDVLIDSLMEEGRYEGVETMCSIRSAIAVTSGYPGYLRRRDTLRTRATAEWWIEESHEDETRQVMQNRVVDFCSRYINAARHGSEALKKCWEKREDTGWPPIWEYGDIDRQHLEAFGRARTNISLYPLSPIAIRALHATCHDDQDQLLFNPRQIINQILLKVLREWRTDAERDQFPPTGITEVSLPVSLRSDLARLGLSDQTRCETLAAIWGYGAENLNALKETLSADIALSFGLNDLARYLKSGFVHEPIGANAKGEEPGKNKREEKPPEKMTVNPGEEKLKGLMTEVDHWCRRIQDLAQEEAKTLRKALASMYHSYGNNDWVGISALPSIKSGPRVNITLPFAAGNIRGWDIEFCSEAVFRDPKKSLLFHDVARTLLRHSHFNPQNGERKGWNYPGGHEDFLRYQNFASFWVPGVLQTLREHERVKVDDLMEKHVAAARTLAIFREGDNHRQRLNKLVRSQQSLLVTLPSPVCETVLTERQAQLDQWDNLQGDWLDLLSSSDHGLEGDLAIQSLKKALQKPLPNRITAVVNRSLGELRKELGCAEWLKDCETIDDFKKALEDLDKLIRTLRTSGKYPQHNDSIVTSKTLSSKVKMLIESGNFEQIQKIKQLGMDIDLERQWQILNDLDGAKIKPLMDLCTGWQAVFDTAFPSLQSENSLWGAERVTEAKNMIDNLLSSLCLTLTKVAGEPDDNA